MEPPPLACTLTPDDRRAQLAWLGELNASALRGYRREGARIELVYHPSAESGVREFVRRERQCCPFLRFTIRDAPDALVVAIEAPPEAADAADALFEPYLTT
jgi:hypothetical protein